MGGVTATARLFGLKGHQNVQYWKRHGAPVELAPKIERECEGAVTVERLCPHVKWVRVKDANWPRRSGRPCVDYARVAD